MAPLRRRVEQRYEACGRFTRGYVHWKLRLDPILPRLVRLAEREQLGHVVDLGCGRGQLGLALLETGRLRSLTGVDWDERLLADARVAAGGRAEFRRGDLRTATVPSGDTVMLIDVLVQMERAAQLDLLRRAAEAARERVILRLFDPRRGWRSGIGWWSERGIRLARLYRRASIRPLSLLTLIEALEGMGFACTTEPCWGIMPLPNVLLVARRRAAPAP